MLINLISLFLPGAANEQFVANCGTFENSVACDAFRCYHSFENLEHFDNSKVNLRPADTDHIWSFDTRLVRTSISQKLPSSPFPCQPALAGSPSFPSSTVVVSFLHCCWEEPFGISGTGSSGTGCRSCHQTNSVKALKGTQAETHHQGKSSTRSTVSSSIY